jgi:hypothetical protein
MRRVKGNVSKSLQTFTNTKEPSVNQPIAMQRIASHRSVVISCVCFCIQHANFYKYKSIINQPTDSIASHRSVVIRARNPRFYFVHARIAGTKPRFLSKMRIKNRGLSDLVVISRRALNPRFLMRLFGQKTGFRARMNEIKSGIQCSASINRPRATHRMAVLSSHACVFVRDCKLLQIQKHHQSRARNPRFWMPLFGQKTGFRARMNEINRGFRTLHQSTNRLEPRATHRIAVLSSHVCSL